MKAKVDGDMCTACEDCVQSVPEVFEMGPDGVAVVKVTVVPADKEDATREMAENCPASAIAVED